MRWVVASIVVHAGVIALIVGARSSSVEVAPPASPPAVAAVKVEIPTDVTFIEEPAVKGGGAAGNRRTSTSTTATSARRASAAPRRSADAWEQVSMRIESADSVADPFAGFGAGSGTGRGTGTGSGIGFGDGGGVRIADEIPKPPPPPEVSKARPAKLIWPTRDEDVDDDANLFVARVTVDEDGDVVGARMIKTRPGARAERAADAIWQFRYAPALDDRGVPTRSTFDQPFQVR